MTEPREDCRDYLKAEDQPLLLGPLGDTKTRRGTFAAPDGTEAFLLEGRILVEKALHEARAGRMHIYAVLGMKASLDGVRELCPPEVPLVEGSPAFVEQLVGYPFHRGLLAYAACPPPAPLEQILAADLLLVLPELVDMTNLGLLVRSAAALGVDAILYGKGPKLYDQRTVRVSMGAVWALPVLQTAELGEVLDTWRARGGQLVAAALEEGSQSSHTWPCTGRTALLLGEEGPGLAPEWLARCDQKVMIPMARGFDSLNVAAAGAILMHLLVAGRNSKAKLDAPCD